jgi:hypothetical protein
VAGGVDQATIVAYVSERFPGVDVLMPTEGPGAGDTFFIYDPERNLQGADQFPFATLVTKDYGDFDRASNLDQPSVYRLNVGVGRETFRSLFPTEAEHDFAALDRLMLHPVYGPQSWVSVLNPGAETFETVKPLLAEAYEIAVARLKRRQGRG